jgi:hypothetical protein
MHENRRLEVEFLREYEAESKNALARYGAEAVL